MIFMIFVSFIVGVWSAGYFSPAIAVIYLIVPAVILLLLGAWRQVGSQRLIWLILLTILLGMIRFAAILPPLPTPDLPVTIARGDEPCTVELTVVEVQGRDRSGTTAVVRIDGLVVGGRSYPVESSNRAFLKSKQMTGLVEGAGYLATGRFVPPYRTPENIGPSWWRRASWPTFYLYTAVELGGPGTGSGHAFDRMRERLGTAIVSSLGPTLSSDMALALLLGEGRGIADEHRDALANLGTSHIVAVSGLHVAIAAGILVALTLPPLLILAGFWFPGLNPIAMSRCLLAFGALAMALLAGPTPSARRAASMVILGVVAMVSGRGRRGLDIVSLVGLATLMVYPEEAFSLSFVLSYSAVTGILTLSKPLAKAMTAQAGPRDQGWPAKIVRQLAPIMSVSIAASLTTSPIAAVAFGTGSFVAPLANLVVVPLLTFVILPMTIGLIPLVYLLGPDMTWPFSAYSWTVESFVLWQGWLASFLPRLDWSAPVPLAVVWGLCALAVAWSLNTRSHQKRWKNILWPTALGVFVALIIHQGPVLDGGPPPQALIVTFLDVGKGDAIAIRCPTGKAFLMDAGEPEAGSKVVAGLRKRGIHHLDGIVLSHGDLDHVGGVATVLSALPVSSLAYPCPEESSVSDLIETAKKLDIPTRCLVRGDEAFPGCGVRQRTYWPPEGLTETGNAASLVVRLGNRSGGILFTGDLEADGEKKLVDIDFDVQAPILKLGHHGSPGASTEEFLSATSPNLAIVSGSPMKGKRSISPYIYKRLSDANAMVAGTAFLGDIDLWTTAPDGPFDWTISTAKVPSPGFQRINAVGTVYPEMKCFGKSQ